MKIAVIGPTYPYKGGISHFTTLLVQNLRKEHTVDFISWKRQYPAFLYPVELKDKTSKNPIKTEASFILDYANPISWYKAVQRIKKEHIDKLIITWVSPVQAPIYFVIASLIKRSTKAKIIYLCHNVLPHEQSPADKPLAKLALTLGDSFIVHSKQDKEILKKLVKNKEILLGFHPVYDVFNTGQKYDINKLKKELGLKEKVLLFFGYIRPYKGLRYLINSLPDILKVFPNTSLLVAGDFWSKDRKSYFDLIYELKVKDNIVMINKYIPDEEIGRYFSVADLAIFPYTSATQSGTLQIAHAFNTPILTTTVGGLKDSIKEIPNTYEIKAKDSKDIAEKVISFFKTKPKQKTVKKFTHDWNAYTSKFIIHS